MKSLPSLANSRVISSQRFRRETVAPERTSIRHALEAAGIEFIDENGGGRGRAIEEAAQEALLTEGLSRGEHQELASCACWLSNLIGIYETNPILFASIALMRAQPRPGNQVDRLK